MPISYLFKRFACKIGFHSAVRREKWTPSIAAEVVTEFEQTHTCERCKKVLSHVHWVWDGGEMVDASPNTAHEVHAA